MKLWKVCGVYKLKPLLDFDIAIIGGGIIGFSIALSLQKTGKSVLIIDRKDNSNNSTPEKSKKKQYALAMKERHMHGTPLKSVSLTELTEIDRARRKGSCSSLRSQWLPKSLASQIHPLEQHGPSSTSSTGTVVQIMKDQDNGYNSACLLYTSDAADE